MIRFENVTKSFFINGKESRVINNINLSIYKKEIYGLVGETGSGKSTILRLMNGFIESDHGNIYLMGKRLDKTTRHDLVKDTSMIFQGFNLLGNLNVIDNVLLPTKLRKGNKKDNIKKARELLYFVGLSNFEQSYIRTLSGGQKQRVAIARTLMTNPKLIFCDEPTSALDEKMSYEVLKLLKEINEEFETTIVVVSHDISVIKALCNRVAIIEKGEISDIVSLKTKKLAPVSYKEALFDDQVPLTSLAQRYTETGLAIMYPTYAKSLELVGDEQRLYVEKQDDITEGYAISLVSRDDNKDSEKIKALIKHVTSEKVRQFLIDEYSWASNPAF